MRGIHKHHQVRISEEKTHSYTEYQKKTHSYTERGVLFFFSASSSMRTIFNANTLGFNPLSIWKLQPRDQKKTEIQEGSYEGSRKDP